MCLAAKFPRGDELHSSIRIVIDLRNVIVGRTIVVVIKIQLRISRAVYEDN